MLLFGDVTGAGLYRQCITVTNHFSLHVGAGFTPAQPTEGRHGKARLRRALEFGHLPRALEPKSPLLGNEGWPRIKKYPRSVKWRGRGGSFKLPIIGGLNQPPRLRPTKEASRYLLNGRSHPSFAKEGNPAFFLAILMFCMHDYVANEVRNSRRRLGFRRVTFAKRPKLQSPAKPGLTGPTFGRLRRREAGAYTGCRSNAQAVCQTDPLPETQV